MARSIILASRLLSESYDSRECQHYACPRQQCR